jgi:hypothetical protein
MNNPPPTPRFLLCVFLSVGGVWSTGKAGTDSLQTKLLGLAAKQRMNTDVRRAVFCALMGSVDFEDAFERLMSLNLKYVTRGCEGHSDPAYHIAHELDPEGMLTRSFSACNPSVRPFTPGPQVLGCGWWWFAGTSRSVRSSG